MPERKLSEHDALRKIGMMARQWKIPQTMGLKLPTGWNWKEDTVTYTTVWDMLERIQQVASEALAEPVP